MCFPSSNPALPACGRRTEGAAPPSSSVLNMMITTTGTGPSGWIITFSDGSFCELYNGKDGTNGTEGKNGATPYLLVDSDGYLCISYDNGNTFTRMMNNSGYFIKATDEIFFL